MLCAIGVERITQAIPYQDNTKIAAEIPIIYEDLFAIDRAGTVNSWQIDS